MKNAHTRKIVARYRKVVGVTVAAIVFLILVGGIVRSTGSGMGCPDWPTCFGKLIPPTDVSQLPDNYQEIYQDRGYKDTEFNALKTWIEYINRLIGALIGLLALATLLASLPLRTRAPRIFYLSLLGFVLILVQAGIGAVVVRSNLSVGMITIHMLIAMACLGIFLTAYLFARRLVALTDASESELEASENVRPDRMWWLLGLSTFVLIIAQIVLGTQVREAVDEVARLLGAAQRDQWIDGLGQSYLIHRYSYYLVVVSMLFWIIKSRAYYKVFPALRSMNIGLVACVGAEVAMGISMHHFAIPAFIQPFHLLVAILIFSFAYSSLAIPLIRSWENRKSHFFRTLASAA